MDWFDIIIFWGPTAVLCAIAFVVGKGVRKWQDFGIVEDYKERGKLALLKPIYIGVGLIILIPLVILFFSLLDDIADIPTNKMITPSEVRNLAIAFVGTITGIGALFGIYLAIRRTEESKRQSDAAQQQANTEEQGQITDRINKAVEGLGRNNQEGAPVLEVRLGSLYALERISQDSIRDHIQIMEILCAYIRTNSPLKPKNTRPSHRKLLSVDIQAALTIIGRRHKWVGGKKYLQKEKAEKYRIDLSHCNLRQAYISGANFYNANFYNTDLSSAWLNHVDFRNAQLDSAIMFETRLNDTKTDSAFMYKGDLSKCFNFSYEQIEVMYCGMGVNINKTGEAELVRPKHWPTDEILWSEFHKRYKAWRTKPKSDKKETPK